MKNRFFAVLAMGFFALVLAGVAHGASVSMQQRAPSQGSKAFRVRIQNDASIEYNNITGPGKGQSTLTDGLHYFDQLNIYSKGQTNSYTYNFNMGVKAVNDSRKDIKEVSFTSLKGRLSNKTHTLTAGDIYNAFSQYSLNTGLKGAAYFYEGKEQQNRLQLVYGTALPRWDSFWSDETETIRRKVFGGKYTHDFSTKLQTGLSILTSEDSNRVFDNVPMYENRLYTVDTNYRPTSSFHPFGESVTFFSPLLHGFLVAKTFTKSS